MTAYVLHLDLPDGPAGPLTIHGDTPDELAAAVHTHARPRLGSRTVDVHLDGLAGTLHRAGTAAGRFRLEPAAQCGPEPADTSAPDHVRHGFTVRDLDRAARAACAADRTYASDMATRYDTAWSAIAEHLVAAAEPPSRSELVQVGWQAIYQDVKAVRRLYGVDSTGRSGEVASAPRFVAYWTRRPDGHDDGLVERIAVHQVLGTLPEHQRQAVVALAVRDDYQAAADALGIKYEAFVARMRFARRTFRGLWFAPDTAPPMKGTDRRVASRAGVTDHCPQGHEFTPENTRWAKTKAGGRSRRCRRCEQIRGAARDRSRKAAA